MAQRKFQQHHAFLYTLHSTYPLKISLALLHSLISCPEKRSLFMTFQESPLTPSISRACVQYSDFHFSFKDHIKRPQHPHRKLV